MQLHFVTTFNKYKSSKIMVVHFKLYIDKCFFYYKLNILNPLQRQFLQICSLLGRLIKDNLYLSCFVLTSSSINNSGKYHIWVEKKSNNLYITETSLCLPPPITRHHRTVCSEGKGGVCEEKTMVSRWTSAGTMLKKKMDHSSAGVQITVFSLDVVYVLIYKASYTCQHLQTSENFCYFEKVLVVLCTELLM